MTLTDLYNSIDWSHLDDAHTEDPSEWVEKLGIDPKIEGKTLNADFVRRFRMVLLQEALESEDRARMMAARAFLKPVWHQVIGSFDPS